MDQLNERARRRFKRLAWISLPFFILMGIGAIILYLKWPFTQQSVADSIQEVVSGDIRIQKFRCHIIVAILTGLFHNSWARYVTLLAAATGYVVN